MKYVHRKKLFSLGFGCQKNGESIDSIFNFSDYNLNLKEQEILSKGLKYVIGPRKPTFVKHFFEMESLFNYISRYGIIEPKSDNQRTFLSKFKILAHSYFKDINKYFNTISEFSKSDLQTLKNLSNNKDIVITKPDKGNGTVILNKSDYVQKMKDILDSTQFQTLNTPLPAALRSVDNRLNTYLRKLKKDSIIEDTVYQRLFSSGSQAGLMYGLPKIHKTNIPLRPILSGINTFNYNLAKFLVPVLAPLTINEYTVSDSFTFAKELVNLRYSEAYMTSFDVVSLYTNIPIDESIEICIKDPLKLNYEGHMSRHVSIKDTLKKLLNFVTKDNIFLFNGRAYKQVDGVAMGSPLGPALANSFLSHHEKIWLDNCPLEFRPIYYRRYIDDTFIIFKEKEHSEKFFQYLNEQHHSIKFTREDEKDNCLSFLDVQITKNADGTFGTSIYRKPSNTGLMCQYSSYVPQLYKINVIRTLTDRAWKLCSSYSALRHEIMYLSNMFFRNGYPQSVFWSQCNRVLDNFYLKKEKIPTVPHAILHHSIQYYGPITDMYKIKIKSLVSSYFPQLKLRLGHSNNLTVGSFFKLKDNIPKEMRSRVVYKYSCEACKASYIGKTIRTLASRISEHLGVSLVTGVPSSNVLYSAIREHMMDEHGSTRVNPANFTILDSGSNDINLKILETLHTIQQRPTIVKKETSLMLRLPEMK